MATGIHLLTVAEFLALPNDKGLVYHELRHGQIVSVTRPKFRHSLIQRNLRRLLEDYADPAAFVDTEVSFRPLAEYELWVADIAYLPPERFAKVDPDDYIHGAPNLVVKVLSPSNTVDEMHERGRICLENGCQEFWLVDPKRQEVKVSTPDGHTVTWRIGQGIPLNFFEGRPSIFVDQVFG